MPMSCWHHSIHIVCAMRGADARLKTLRYDYHMGSCCGTKEDSLQSAGGSEPDVTAIICKQT